MFTNCKQLVDQPFNNAYHINKVILSIVNKHSNNLFANGKSRCKQSQQGIYLYKHFNNLFTL